jgi:hypothetical protein
MSLLDREEILRLFEDLSEELEARGTRAEVFLVGGAAIAVAYDGRRATRDLDAVFQPKEDVYAAREQDIEDIVLLYRLIGFTTVAEGLDLVEAAYPGRPISPKGPVPPGGVLRARGLASAAL